MVGSQKRERERKRKEVRFTVAGERIKPIDPEHWPTGHRHAVRVHICEQARTLKSGSTTSY